MKSYTVKFFDNHQMVKRVVQAQGINDVCDKVKQMYDWDYWNIISIEMLCVEV